MCPWLSRSPDWWYLARVRRNCRRFALEKRLTSAKTLIVVSATIGPTPGRRSATAGAGRASVGPARLRPGRARAPVLRLASTLFEMTSKRGYIRRGLEQAVPSCVGPEAVLLSARPTGTSQEALGSLDLGHLNTEEVTSAREGRAKLGDLRPRDMDDGSVKAPARASRRSLFCSGRCALRTSCASQSPGPDAAEKGPPVRQP